MQGLDQFGVRGGIHHRHSLLAIARTAIPEVDAIEPVSRNEDCDLAHEIGNLRIGHVAEPDAAATAFDADAHLAAFVLHLSDVFVGMLYRITQIGSRSEEGAFRIGSIAHLSDSQIDDIPQRGRINRFESSHILFFPSHVVGIMRLYLAGVEIEYGCPLGIQFYIRTLIARLIDVLIEFPNSDAIIKHLLLVPVFGGIDDDRHQIDARSQVFGVDCQSEFIRNPCSCRNRDFTIAGQGDIGKRKRHQSGTVGRVVGFDKLRIGLRCQRHGLRRRLSEPVIDLVGGNLFAVLGQVDGNPIAERFRTAQCAGNRFQCFRVRFLPGLIDNFIIRAGCNAHQHCGCPQSAPE